MTENEALNALHEIVYDMLPTEHLDLPRTVAEDIAGAIYEAGWRLPESDATHASHLATTSGDVPW